MRPKINKGVRLLLMAFLLLGSFQVSGQIIQNLAIEPADNPNSAGVSVWDKICAGNNGGFNEYYAVATFDGASNSGNEWILELSDASGDFTNAVELARETDDALVEDPGFQFAIPTDTRGDSYKLRVRSTDPAEEAETAIGYSMYYMDFVANLIITDDGSGVPQGTICSSSDVTLSIDNLPNASSYQFRWYRDLTLITGETGPSLTVTQSGMYFVQIDYGDCSDNSTTDSNMPDITIGASGGGSTINPPSKTALCPADTETLTVNTVVTSPTYDWMKDGVSTGITTATFTVDGSVTGFEGDYQVEISSGTNCPEITPAITFTNAGNFTVTRVNAANLVLLPSDTENLSVTTTAASPTFQWFRNGAAIAGATNINYDAAQEGTYYCEVTQPAGACPNPTTVNSEETEVVTPASFEVLIAYGTSYEACVSTDVVLDVDTINAVLSDGSTIDVTSDVQSSFTYQWNRNGSAVGGATSSSISLADTSENGDYTVDGTLSTYNSTSNHAKCSTVDERNLDHYKYKYSIL